MGISFPNETHGIKSSGRPVAIVRIEFRLSDFFNILSIYGTV